MKKKICLLLTVWLLFTASVSSQIAINTGGSPPDSTAALHVDSDSLGFLPPRMTTAQRDAIVDPADGLMIYNYDNHRIEYYDSQNWRQMFQQTSTDVVCGNDFYDTRDNRIYGTVWIGGQCWMTENLNYGGMIDGGTAMTQNGYIEKYCYDDTTVNCSLYGGLYQWDEMMAYGSNGTQGICPDGWHVASDEEWKTMEGTIDGTYGVGNTEWDGTGWRGDDAGYHLKAINGWGTTGNGDNSSGFTALPGGYAYSGNFNNLNYTAYLWTGSDDSGNGIARILDRTEDRISRNLIGKSHGYSVRCIKDD